MGEVGRGQREEWSFRTTDDEVAYESWARMLSSTHLPWSVRELDDQRPDFGASVRRRHLADLVLVDCTCDPCAGVRRLPQIADTDEEYLVVLMTLKGRETVAQRGNTSYLEPGSVVVWDSCEPADFAVHEPLVKRSLFVPKAALSEFGSRGALVTGTALDRSAAAVRLLWQYLDGLSGTIDELPLGALPAARNATIELLAAALQHGPADPHRTSVAVVAAAEAYIERHLWSPDLCPAAVAAGVNVSLRSLHRAFESTPDSVAGSIRTRRLARARDELHSGLSVAQVAARLHYSNPSHFARAFKTHYGHSPSDLVRPDRGHVRTTPVPSASTPASVDARPDVDRRRLKASGAP